METIKRTKAEIEEAAREVAINLQQIKDFQNEKKRSMLMTCFRSIPSLMIRVSESYILFYEQKTGRSICEGWIQKKYSNKTPIFELSFSSGSSDSDFEIERAIILGKVFEIFQNNREEIISRWESIENHPHYESRVNDLCALHLTLMKEAQRMEKEERELRFKSFLKIIETKTDLPERMNFELFTWKSRQNTGEVCDVCSIRLITKTPKTYTIELTEADYQSRKAGATINRTYTINQEKMEMIFQKVTKAFEKAYSI